MVAAPTPPESQTYPGVYGLDDLELLKLGLIPPELVPWRDQPRTLVDAEGVAVATVDAEGQTTWLTDRSSRPFEVNHLRTNSLPGRVAVVNDSRGLDLVPTDITTLAVMASLDGEETAEAMALVRAARTVASQSGGSLVVIPLAAEAPDRSAKAESVLRALSRNAPLTDLTNDPPKRHGPAARGRVILFTGLSGSGKSTIARALRHRLVEEGDREVSLLDGDLVRRNLSSGLGFSLEDRQTNVRRIGWVAAEIARHGGWVIASPIAPFEDGRREIDQMVQARGGAFVLVHVATPLDECERRDRKGLYARARAGDIPEFTGISSPYEIPAHPTLRLDTTGRDVDSLVAEVLDVLEC